MKFTQHLSGYRAPLVVVGGTLLSAFIMREERSISSPVTPHIVSPALITLFIEQKMHARSYFKPVIKAIIRE